MSGAKKGELALRDKAILHQQRRLKQATQFTHKDSADLLPLDSLNRLGTSKDLQPHSIVQRRLLEGNMTRLRGEGRDPNSRIRFPLADSREGGGDAEERSESTADDSTEERESPEESERSLRSDEEDASSEAGGKTTTDEARETIGKTEEEEGEDEGMKERQRTETSGSPSTLFALLVQCKCCETEVTASINTGSQHNSISSSYCQRLGLIPSQEGPPCSQTEGCGPANTVRGLQLQLGRQRIQCSAHVTEDEGVELCLGLQTLLELKCCVDLSSRVLKLPGSAEGLPFLETPPSDSQCHHDNHENQ